MSDIIEEVEYRGFNIQIRADEYPEPFNPRIDIDNLGRMVCFHSRYDLLGDEPRYESPKHFLMDVLTQFGEGEDKIDEDWYDEDFIAKYLGKLQKYAIALPLYLYDHSGITMNTTGFCCPWDSGQVGWIYVSKEAVKREWGWKKLTKKRIRKIEGILRSEVETYDYYLTGDIYGYTIEAKENQKEITCDDSCWGFYGYDHEKSGLLGDAKYVVDRAIRAYRQEVREEKKRRKVMDLFMRTCWAH